MKPLVYIILVNWNGIDDTVECLDSLKKITYPNYKVVLVDNGSKDNQAEKLKKIFPDVFLIKNKINTGFVGANNQGIKIALKNKAKHVLLLNNDTVVKENFLDILVEEIESSKNVGAISPKILYYKSNKIWSMGGKISILTGISIMIGKGKNSVKYLKNIEPDFLTGCAFLIKSEIIKKVGLLDPIYFAYYEDVDWSYRIRKSGYKILVNPDSIIWHKKSASAGIKNSFRKESNYQISQITRNGLIFFRKNFDIYHMISFLLFRFIYTLVFSGLGGLRFFINGLIDGFKK